MVNELINLMKKNNTKLADGIQKLHKEITAYQDVIDQQDIILDKVNYAITPSSTWKKIDITKMQEEKAYLVRESKKDKYPMVAEFINGQLRFIHGVGDSSIINNFNPKEVYLPKRSRG